MVARVGIAFLCLARPVHPRVRGEHKASNRAIGEDSAARSFANTSLLEVDVGYAGRQDIWKQDVLTPTRLGDPVTAFRLAKSIDGRIVPFCGDDSTPKSWALSEVSINSRWANAEAIPSDALAAVERARANWPEWEKTMPILILTKANEPFFEGRARKDNVPLLVSYDPDAGLRMGI